MSGEEGCVVFSADRRRARGVVQKCGFKKGEEKIKILKKKNGVGSSPGAWDLLAAQSLELRKWNIKIPISSYLYLSLSSN